LKKKFEKLFERTEEIEFWNKNTVLIYNQNFFYLPEIDNSLIARNNK
jgi:hypothetical protein